MADIPVVFKGDHSSVDNSVSKVKGGIAGISTAAKGLGAAFKSAFAPLLIVGAALGGVSAITSGIKDIIDLGGDLDDLSTSTGIAVKELVLLQEAFKLAGVSSDLVGKAVTGLSVKLNQPTPKIIETIANLGLSLADLQAMPMGEQFSTIGRSIGELSSQSERAAASATLFGKSLGQGLLPLFADPALFDTASKSVGQLGTTMEDNASKFAKIGDALDSVITKVRQFFASFIGANADKLVQIADAFMSIDLTKAGETIGRMLRDVVTIVQVLGKAFNEGTLGVALLEAFTYGWLSFKPLIMDGFIQLSNMFVDILLKGVENAVNVAKTGSTSNFTAAASLLIPVVGPVLASEIYAKGTKEAGAIGQTKTTSFLLTDSEQAILRKISEKFQIGAVANEKAEKDRLEAARLRKDEVSKPVLKAPLFGPATPTAMQQKTMNEFATNQEKTRSSLFEKLFGKTTELPTTSLQRIGGASRFTGANQTLTEQKETNNILRQIKDLLGKDVAFSTPSQVSSFA